MQVSRPVQLAAGLYNHRRDLIKQPGDVISCSDGVISQRQDVIRCLAGAIR